MTVHTPPGAPGRPTPVAGAGPHVPGELTDELLSSEWWTDQQVAAAGIPVFDSPFVTVGGGLGSFVLVDFLRIAGVPPAQIRILTQLDEPHLTYRYLCGNSQIPDRERIRSDSSSMPDNAWGWPGLALREAFDGDMRKRIGGRRGPAGFFAPIWNVFAEPIGLDYYTPMAGHVFETVRREEARIGWQSMISKGQVRMIRRRHGGGYFVILTPPQGSYPTKRVAFRARFVHVAVGYPGLRFLPDLQAYRERYRDHARVVNAYESHEHVYQELLSKPSTVVVRGSGIVGSRILQRLMDDVEQRGAQTTIVHLFRNYVSGKHGTRFARRHGGDGWAYQGFNYPKSGWGGQLYWQLRRTDDPAARAAIVRQVGGTNTPRRRYWQQQMARARSAGWYQIEVGEVDEVVPGPNGTVVTRIRTTRRPGISEIPANFVIDATGLEADPRDHRVLADLIDHGGAGTNALGRLDVDRSFEIRGSRSEPGRLYASGSSTLGGYVAPVDSFLGLQLAALEITDDLARQGFGKRIGPGRSVSHWWKWARNTAI